MNPHNSLSVLLLAFLPLRAAEPTVVLSLDYSNRSTCSYAVDFRSTLTLSEAGTSNARNTHISCALNGSLNEAKDRLLLTVADVNVESELYAKDVRKAVVQKLAAATYSLPLTAGYPTLDTLVDLSSMGLPEWNLYMQLGKLLLDVPSQAVKRGFTWERTVSLPMRTAQGNTLCEVYRRYTLERLSQKNDTAYVRWEFRYSAEKPHLDSASVIEHVPVRGKGTGSAVIDLTAALLVRAAIDFETPLATIGNAKATWKENALLTLQSGK
jgi:hypothetical protein